MNMSRFIQTVVALVLVNIAAFAQPTVFRINQVGYAPDAIKVAVLGSKDDIAVRSFEVVDVQTGETRYRGNTVRAFGSYACFRTIFRLEFSDFSENGTFFIRAGKIESPPWMSANTRHIFS